MLKKKSDILSLALFTIITLLVLLLSALSNKVFMYQPYAYLVDEISDLQILNKFYSIASFSDFIDLFFITNPEHYHGFITYLIPAITSYIPFKLGGEPYLIFSFRMTSAIFIISSYILTAFTFFQKTYQRLLFYVILLLLPFTNMFIMWPRCESYQYFFFALFLFLIKRKPKSLHWPFLFLGLSMAARISTIPYIILIGLYFYLNQYRGTPGSTKKTMKSAFAIILGFFIGLPHLFYLPNIKDWLGYKYAQMFNDTGMDSSFTFSSWMDTAMVLYTGYEIIFYLITLLFIIVFYYSASKGKNLNDDQKYNLQMPLLLGLCGLICLFAIMCKIQIIYSYWYLQQHYMFLLLGLLAPLNHFKFAPLQRINSVLLFSIFILAMTFGFEYSPFFTNHGWNFSWAITRDQEPENIENEKNYQDIVKKMGELSRRSHKKLVFRVLADHWQPRSTENYIVKSEWHPSPFFNFGDDQSKDIDAIFINKELYYPPEKMITNIQEGEADIREKGYKLYKKMVCNTFHGESKEADCFAAMEVNEKFLLLYKKSIPFKNRK